MFASKKEENNYNDRDIRAFLEHGCEFEGTLTFSGVVRINGKLKGDILTEDTLIIGDTAEIEGNIHAGAVIIGGRFRGDVVAKYRVEIQSTAIIQGRLSSPSLITHEGAQISGQIEVAVRASQPANSKSSVA